jgi:hypothetical protein
MTPGSSTGKVKKGLYRAVTVMVTVPSRDASIELIEKQSVCTRQGKKFYYRVCQHILWI